MWGARLLLCHHTVLLRGHISSWSKMMRKALVQHSSSLPESILCPALLRAKIALAGQWGGSERESVCREALLRLHRSKWRPTCWTMLLCKSLVATLALKWTGIFHKLRLPISNECSNLERHDTYFKTAPRSASLSLASPGSSPVQGIMSASVYLSTKG